jgi:hypothetical protein
MPWDRNQMAARAAEDGIQVEHEMRIKRCTTRERETT